MKIILYSPLENKLSINALAGALASDSGLRDLHAAFPATPQELLKEAAEKHVPTVAGFSFFSSQSKEAAALARALRKKHGRALILIAGGAHPSGAPQETLRMGFDAVCLGEGEATFTEFIRSIKAGQDWRGIDGLAFLSDGKMLRGKPRRPINLDAFPPFSEHHGRYGVIEITRGCPHACKFCQTSHLHGLRQRHRSVETVLGYARLMHSKGMSDFRAVSPDAFSYGSKNGRVNLA
ncbi:MAG TPA: cobalamin-dependent protein, partial [Elusimicrobiales bacterium]|nr:cobalamin-dependent protein [Elusimicrobiales bacterium]